ncbi:MAG TPA: tetratricopeptide repeat protein, partial [Candidatus Acidoferrum sp.]|nr:tetratricopeptide repeat protein [Candidatus Acidoferrum sp.]
KAGAEIAAETNKLQAAVFATNSGKRLMNAGDLEGAISQFRAAIGDKPEYAAAHYQLGLALQRRGDAEGAKREFAEASRLDPNVVAP